MLLFGFSLAILMAWIWLAQTRLRAFGSPPRLEAAGAAQDAPGVVAIIPARNEAATIGAVVAAHAGSDYPGEFSVIVVDDHSSDATRARAAQSGGDRVRVIEAPPLPDGWSGKLWAVNAGLQCAMETAPDAKFVLLTDADIVLAPTTLSRLVARAQTSGAALVSLMARLDARGVWGGLLIPAFVFFFYKLYPFHRVNDPAARIAAAAGGCMLVRRDALSSIGGVQKIADRLIDDCALAAEIKKSGGALWLGMAKDEAVSLRDNRALSSVWSMVARTAFTQLNHSWAALAGAVAGMAALYLAAPAIALSYPLHQNAGAATVSAAAWALIALAYSPTARIYDQARWKTFLLPAAAFFYSLMTVSSAILHARGEGGAWKGRTYRL
ncbi:MAG: glycosyltransferase [Parvularculaceae bacterium]|nr:glycosyltransferase [Parvularculaceae bacterium]